MNIQEVNEILSRANRKLSAKVAVLENDLALAHAQIDMLQEILHKVSSELEELKKQKDKKKDK